jgi:predicted aspartyl protease
VDTGSDYTWIPGKTLEKLGVDCVKKDIQFVMANGQTITRSVGYVILFVDRFQTVDEVVFGQPGDQSLLGARTLEGFNAGVDPKRKRLVASGPLSVAQIIRRVE